MTIPNPRILCVDDNEDTSALISLMLQRSNPAYEITSVKSVTEALRLASPNEFDLYLLDYRYPEMTGVDLCRTIRQRDMHTPIMFFTGEAHERERQEAMNAGANAYLVKPTDLNKLTATAKHLLGAERVIARYAAQSSNESAETNMYAS